MKTSKLFSSCAAKGGNNASKLLQQKLEALSTSLASHGPQIPLSTRVYSSGSKACLTQAFCGLLVLFSLKGHDEHNQTFTARCLAHLPVRSLHCQKLDLKTS